ncbi:MAG: RNA polymerase sigma factor [Bacteroidota bacterium]
MLEEQLLIDRAKRGDMQAFRELVEGSKRMVFGLAYNLTGNRHDAEDLSQDVFVKAYRSLINFRGDAKWNTWLYRITVNTCMDHGRSTSSRSAEIPYDSENNEPPTGSAHSHNPITPDRKAESSMIQQHIESALNTLSRQERSVFVLRHYHDFSLKQIAQTLEIAEGTVKSYLFRAIQHLQQELSFYRKELGMDEQL